MKVFVYRKCSTCMKALKWLEAHNVEFEERAIKEENPTYEELKEWYTMSGLPLKKFFNTSGMLYKQMNLKDKLKEMTEDDQLKLLATDGMLVKRTRNWRQLRPDRIQRKKSGKKSCYKLRYIIIII